MGSSDQLQSVNWVLLQGRRVSQGRSRPLKTVTMTYRLQVSAIFEIENLAGEGRLTTVDDVSGRYGQSKQQLMEVIQ